MNKRAFSLGYINKTAEELPENKSKLSLLMRKLFLSVSSQLSKESPEAKRMFWHGLWGKGKPYDLDVTNMGAGVKELMQPVINVDNKTINLGEFTEDLPIPDTELNIEKRPYRGLIRGGTTPKVDLDSAVGTFTGKVGKNPHGLLYSVDGKDIYDWHPLNTTNKWGKGEFTFATPKWVADVYKKLRGTKSTRLPFMSDSDITPPTEPIDKWKLGLSTKDIAEVQAPFKVNIRGENLPFSSMDFKNRSKLRQHLLDYGQLYKVGGAATLSLLATYATYKYLTRQKKRENREDK